MTAEFYSRVKEYDTIMCLMVKSFLYCCILLVCSSAAWGKPSSFCESAPSRVYTAFSVGYVVGQQKVTTKVHVKSSYKADFFIAPAGERVFSGSFLAAPVFALSLIHISEPTRPY